MRNVTLHQAQRFGVRAATVSLTLVLAACGGGGGDEADDPVAGGPTPTPAPPAPAPGNNAPVITNSAPGSVTVGEAYSYLPAASDPDGDDLTFSIENKPDWADFSSSTGRLAGTPTVGSSGIYGDIRITVSDGQDTASTGRFQIDVLQQVAAGRTATVMITAPTQNTDGSPLTDLAGYRIYYGQPANLYANRIEIDNPGITTYVVENLTPADYQFVVTAYNTSGFESDPSDPESVTINN
ncbi:MAG: putative Ig domain-containing protein [Pseudomonadota bacterium]